MADADEDAIPRNRPSTTGLSSDPADDLEDEAQDFRFLVQLTASKSATSGALPKRGEKDFEPNPTQAQSNTLAASRQAMHDALSVERVLVPRNPLVGQYLPNERDWRWDSTSTEEDSDDTQRFGGRCVVVEKFRTTYGRSIGVADHRNWTWLLPEEALFLIERGTLDVRWPDKEADPIVYSVTESTEQESEDKDETGIKYNDLVAQVEDDNSDQDDEGNLVEDSPLPKPRRKTRHFHLTAGEVPMSLQGAYASFIGKSGLTLERYSVYAGLRRLGYIVRRAPTWGDNDDQLTEQAQYTNGHASEPNGHITQPLIPTTLVLPPPVTVPLSPSSPATTLINRLVAFLFPPKPHHYRPGGGPLIYPGLYKNYNDIFRTLSLVRYHSHNPNALNEATPRPKAPFTVCWHVHKPSPNTTFRKTAPPPPDFRIAVLDARTTSVPTLSELGPLLDSMPPDELPKDKRMEQRLKHGMRNVILAVVDSGLVSYLRVADVCSGSEGKVFETKSARGGKRGGGGGWKGRGQGRGQGGKR